MKTASNLLFGLIGEAIAHIKDLDETDQYHHTLMIQRDADHQGEKKLITSTAVVMIQLGINKVRNRRSERC